MQAENNSQPAEVSRLITRTLATIMRYGTVYIFILSLSAAVLWPQQNKIPKWLEIIRLAVYLLQTGTIAWPPQAAFITTLLSCAVATTTRVDRE